MHYCLGPWLHFGVGSVLAYAFGSIPKVEKYLLEQHEQTFQSWKRKQAKNDAMYASTLPISLSLGG